MGIIDIHCRNVSCLQAVLLRLIDASVTFQPDPLLKHELLPKTIADIDQQSKRCLHASLLSLVAPFHDDPTVQKQFWQRVMPLVAEWSQDYVENEVKLVTLDPFAHILSKKLQSYASYALQLSECGQAKLF